MLVCPCTAVVHEEYRESEGDNKQGTGDLSQEYQALSSTIRYFIGWSFFFFGGGGGRGLIIFDEGERPRIFFHIGKF